MSIFGTMKTAVSGMSAQANRLSTVGDNIANAGTTGYKKSSTAFSTMVLPSTAGSYSSGGVQTNVRYSIAEQGTIQYTTSSTDLAISGEGFFIVQDANGTPYLTRAGSFQVSDSGELVNAGGYTLMGYSYDSGAPAAVVNGFDGLEAINVKKTALSAAASTTGAFPVNLNADATAITGDLPSSNSASATYTSKSSLVAYDSLGHKVLYDFYYSKTSDNTWEVSVYRQDGATAGTSFPYADAAVGTATLSFDPTTGAMTGGSDLGITMTDATYTPPQEINIDFTGTTQLAYAFTPGNATIDGSAPSSIDSVQISADGIVSAVYEDGKILPLYRIPMATVPSPDNLVPVSGNVYSQGNNSGIITTGFPGSGVFGTIQSGALEGSNVDIASELTEMIESQRSYTANSKVFQTGADIMDVLIGLKR